MTRKMKDSGIEWIGEIPEDWSIAQVKHLFEIGRGRVISKEELSFDAHTGYPVYSSQTKNEGVLGYIGTYDFDEPQLTWTTDGANAGTVFLRRGKYNCTNVCGTLKLKSNVQDKISLEYIYHALYVGAPYYKRKDTNGYKIMNNEMAVIKISLPPFDMQEKISKKIKGKVKTIHDLVVKTNQSIAELKKYKQSLITEVVTKGLDPNVEMKDSEIEWIGEIPRHWEERKMKYIFNLIDERNTNEDAELLSLYTSIGVKPRAELEERGNKAQTVINYKVVKKDDLIVNKLLAWMGAIAFSDYEGVTSPDYDIYRIKNINDADKSYYNYYFRYTNFKDDCYKVGRGIMLMRWRTYPEQLLKIAVTFPPIKEQHQIVSYLDEQTSRIDKLIEDKTKVIEELESYKKSLIYEYVTGKKEV